jgi:dipeptide transport system substrate-binding protein
MPVSRPYNPNAQRVAELIQADYAKIGVKAEIVSYEWTEYRERGKAKDRDGAFQLGWTGDNGDPDNFLFLLGCDAIGQSNYAIWCNQEFQDLLLKGKATTDVAERTKIYEEAQVVFKREAPWLTIAHSKVFMPMNKKVEGFVMDPLGIHRFDGVDVAE